MCDESDLIYKPGDIVWFKFSSVWWPAEVQDQDKLEKEVTKGLKKRPLAVVKFFNEDTYEFVRNLDQIYFYNCPKKNDFIKQGLEKCRPGGHKSIPTCMIKFQPDVVEAETRTGGNPDILTESIFQPEQKPELDYSNLFASATPKYKAKKRLAHHSLNEDGRPPSKAPLPRPSLGSQVKIFNDMIPAALSRQQASNGHRSLYSCDCCPFTAPRLTMISDHCKNCKPSAPLPYYPTYQTPVSKTISPKKKKIAHQSGAKGSAKGSVTKKKLVKKVKTPMSKAPCLSEKEIREGILKDWEDEDEEDESALNNSTEVTGSANESSASKLLEVLGDTEEEEKEGDEREGESVIEEVVIDGTVDDEKNEENDLKTAKVDEQVVPDSDQDLPHESKKENEVGLETRPDDNDDLAQKIDELLESTEMPALPGSEKINFEEKKKSDSPEASAEIASTEGQGSPLKKKNVPHISSPGARSIAAIKISENSAVEIDSAIASSTSTIPLNDKQPSEGSPIVIDRSDSLNVGEPSVSEKTKDVSSASAENLDSSNSASVAVPEVDDVDDIVQLEKELECFEFDSESSLNEAKVRGDSSYEHTDETETPEITPVKKNKADIDSPLKSVQPSMPSQCESPEVPIGSPSIASEEKMKEEAPEKASMPMTRSKRHSLPDVDLESLDSKSKAGRKETETEEGKKPRKVKNSLSSKFRRALEEVTRGDAKESSEEEATVLDKSSADATKLGSPENLHSDVAEVSQSEPIVEESVDQISRKESDEKRISMRSLGLEASNAFELDKSNDEKTVLQPGRRSLRIGERAERKDQETKKEMAPVKKLKGHAKGMLSNDAPRVPPKALRATRRSSSKGSISSSEIVDSTNEVATESADCYIVEQTSTTKRPRVQRKQGVEASGYEHVEKPTESEPLQESAKEPIEHVQGAERETRVSRRLKGEAALIVKASPRVSKLKNQNKQEQKIEKNSAAELLTLLETDSDKEGKDSAGRSNEYSSQPIENSKPESVPCPEEIEDKSEQNSTPSHRLSRLSEQKLHSRGSKTRKSSNESNSARKISESGPPLEHGKTEDSSALTEGKQIFKIPPSGSDSAVCVELGDVQKEDVQEIRTSNDGDAETPVDIKIPKKKGRPRKDARPSGVSTPIERSVRVTRSRGSQDEVTVSAKIDEVSPLKTGVGDIVKVEAVVKTKGRLSIKSTKSEALIAPLKSEPSVESSEQLNPSEVEIEEEVPTPTTKTTYRTKKHQRSTSVSAILPPEPDASVDLEKLAPSESEDSVKNQEEAFNAASAIKSSRPRKLRPSTSVSDSAPAKLELAIVSDVLNVEEAIKTPTKKKGGRPRKQRPPITTPETPASQSRLEDANNAANQNLDASKPKNMDESVSVPSGEDLSRMKRVSVALTTYITDPVLNDNLKPIPNANDEAKVKETQSMDKEVALESHHPPHAGDAMKVEEALRTPTSRKGGRPRKKRPTGPSSNSKECQDMPSTPSTTTRAGALTRSSDSKRAPLVPGDIQKTPAAVEMKKPGAETVIEDKRPEQSFPSSEPSEVDEETNSSKKPERRKGRFVAKQTRIKQALSNQDIKEVDEANRKVPEASDEDGKSPEFNKKPQQTTPEEGTKNTPDSAKSGESEDETKRSRHGEDSKAGSESPKKDVTLPKKRTEKRAEVVKEDQQPLGEDRRSSSDVKIAEVKVCEDAKYKDDLASKRTDDSAKTNKRKSDQSDGELAKKLKIETPITPPLRIIEEIDMFQEKSKPIAGPLKKSDPASIRKNMEQSKKSKGNVSVLRSSRSSKETVHPVTDANKVPESSPVIAKKKKKDLETSQSGGKLQPLKTSTSAKKKVLGQVITRTDLPSTDKARSTCSSNEPPNDLESPPKKIKLDTPKPEKQSSKDKELKVDSTKVKSRAQAQDFKKPAEASTVKKSTEIVEARKEESLPFTGVKEKHTKKIRKDSAPIDKPSSPTAPAATEIKRSEIQANVVQDSQTIDSLSLTPTKPPPAPSSVTAFVASQKTKSPVSKDPRLPENRAKVDEASLKKEPPRNTVAMKESPPSVTPAPKKPEKGKIKFSSYAERLHAKQAAEDKNKVETGSLTPPLPSENLVHTQKVEFKEKTTVTDLAVPHDKGFVSTHLTLPPKKGILKNVSSSLSFSAPDDSSPSSTVQQILLAAKSKVVGTLGITTTSPILSSPSIAKKVSPSLKLDTSDTGKEPSPTTTPPKQPPPKLNDITPSEIDSVPESLKEDFLGFLSEKSLIDIVHTTSASKAEVAESKPSDEKELSVKLPLASHPSPSNDLELPRRRQEPDEEGDMLETKLTTRTPKVIKFSEKCFGSLSTKETLTTSAPESPRTPPLPPPSPHSATSPVRPKSRWSQSSGSPRIEPPEVPDKSVETCSKKSRVPVEVHWGTKTSPVKKSPEYRDKTEFGDIKRKLSADNLESDSSRPPKAPWKNDLADLETPGLLPPVPPEKAPELPPAPQEEPSLTPPLPVPPRTISQNQLGSSPAVARELSNNKTMSSPKEEATFEIPDSVPTLPRSPEPSTALPPLHTWIDDVASIPLPPEPAPPTAKSPIWALPKEVKEVKEPSSPAPSPPSKQFELNEDSSVDAAKKESPVPDKDSTHMDIDLDEIPIPDLPPSSTLAVDKPRGEYDGFKQLEPTANVTAESVEEKKKKVVDSKEVDAGVIPKVIVESGRNADEVEEKFVECKEKEVVVECKGEVVVERKEEVVVDRKEEVFVERTKEVVVERNEEVVVERKEEAIVERKGEVVEGNEDVVIQSKGEVVVEDMEEIVVEDKEDKTDIYEEVVYEDNKYEDLIIENPNDWGGSEVVIDGAEAAAEKNLPKPEPPVQATPTFDPMGMDFDINSMPVVYGDEFLSDLNDASAVSAPMSQPEAPTAAPVNVDHRDSPASPDAIPVEKPKKRRPEIRDLVIIIRPKTGEVAENIFEIPPSPAFRPGDRPGPLRESSHRHHRHHHHRHHSSSHHGSRHSVSRSSLPSSSFRIESSVDRTMSSSKGAPPGKLFIVANATSTGSGQRSVTMTPPTPSSRLVSVKGQLPHLEKQSSNVALPALLKSQTKPGPSTVPQSIIKHSSTKVPSFAPKVISKPKASGPTVQLIASKQGGPPKMVLMSANKPVTLGNLVMNPSTTSSNQNVDKMLFVPSSKSSSALSSLIKPTSKVKLVATPTPNIAQKPAPVKKPVPVQSNIGKKVTMSPQVVPQKLSNAPIMLQIQPAISESLSTEPHNKLSIVQGSAGTNDQILYLAMDDQNSPILTIDSSSQQTFLQSANTNQTNNLIILNNPCAVDPQSTAVTVSQGDDILAKALANTQVLQSDISDVQSLENAPVYIDEQFPIASLSHNVLETSLTLNQPIMTPIEQPSIAQSTNSNSTSQVPILTESDLSESAMYLTTTPAGKQQPVAYQVMTSSSSNVVSSNQTQLIISAPSAAGGDPSTIVLGNLQGSSIGKVQTKLPPLVSFSQKPVSLPSIHLRPDSVSTPLISTAQPPSTSSSFVAKR